MTGWGESLQRPCPRCGKVVQFMANGNLRPHNVPIEQRVRRRWAQRCRE